MNRGSPKCRCLWPALLGPACALRPQVEAEGYLDFLHSCGALTTHMEMG